jgi:hypothetical protein
MQPVLKLFLTLLLAHLLGDFPFQSAQLVANKRHGTRAYLAHGIIHFIVLVVCVAVFGTSGLVTSYWFWIVVTLYIGVHLLIDAVKQRVMNTGKVPESTRVFVVDQGLHLCTIGVVSWLIIRPSWASLKAVFSWSATTADRVLEAGIVYLGVVFAGGYLIRYLTRDLSAGIDRPGETAEQVKNAGMYIGWLERFLVITAILVQSPSMVGLILAGKSIARFPELKERFAEYFLIGTLLSIGLAVIGGLVLLKLWFGTIALK